MLFLPFVTALTKRFFSSCGNLRRSNAPASAMREPWQGAQFRAKMTAPFLICSGTNCRPVPCAAERERAAGVSEPFQASASFRQHRRRRRQVSTPSVSSQR